MSDLRRRCVRHRASTLAAIIPLVLLSACGSDGDGGDLVTIPPAPTPTPTPTPTQTFAQKCAALEGKTYAASDISLPTTGALLQNAAIVAANSTTPEYCKVTGAIMPVDRFAPPINFQLNLPSAWNEKALQMGGGGNNGSVVTGLGNAPGTGNTGTPIPTPLQRGYATFGSDGGHTGSDPSFGLNQEAFINHHTGDQLRKTLDVAQATIRAVYGSAPKKQYFVGSSYGGGEAWAMAQRFPDKYDGYISYYPTMNLAMMTLQVVKVHQTVFNTPGGHLNPAKRSLVSNLVMNTCDSLDGATDGLISNRTACQTAVKFNTLRCSSGSDDGDGCLSDVQLAVLNTVISRFTNSFAIANGLNSTTSFDIFGGDNLATVAYPDSPVYNGGFTPGTLRYFVTQDGTANVLTHNPDAYTAQWQRYSAAVDRTTTDLTGLRSRGKMIWLHGGADGLVQSGVSTDYYSRLRAVYGESTLAQFLRFYLVPGYGHGNGPFNVSWDSLSALERWVENGTAPTPDSQVITDSNTATRGRTRPLCDYPKFAKYKGSGDINVAASFECTPL